MAILFSPLVAAAPVPRAAPALLSLHAPFTASAHERGYIAQTPDSPCTHALIQVRPSLALTTGFGTLEARASAVSCGGAGLGNYSYAEAGFGVASMAFPANVSATQHVEAKWRVVYGAAIDVQGTNATLNGLASYSIEVSTYLYDATTATLWGANTTILAAGSVGYGNGSSHIVSGVAQATTSANLPLIAGHVYHVVTYLIVWLTAVAAGGAGDRSAVVVDLASNGNGATLFALRLR